jgi:hypothetical protein
MWWRSASERSEEESIWGVKPEFWSGLLDSPTIRTSQPS